MHGHTPTENTQEFVMRAGKSIVVAEFVKPQEDEVREEMRKREDYHTVLSD